MVRHPTCSLSVHLHPMIPAHHGVGQENERKPLKVQVQLLTQNFRVGNGHGFQDTPHRPSRLHLSFARRLAHCCRWGAS